MLFRLSSFFSPTCQQELELPQTFAFHAKLKKNETNGLELKSETFELSRDTTGQPKNTHTRTHFTAPGLTRATAECLEMRLGPE